jgi:hypothetical protein
MTNGQPLAAAEQSAFQVLITVDRNLQYQQRLHDRKIALVILEGRSTNLDDLLPLVPGSAGDKTSSAATATIGSSRQGLAGALAGLN